MKNLKWKIIVLGVFSAILPFGVTFSQGFGNSPPTPSPATSEEESNAVRGIALQAYRDRVGGYRASEGMELSKFVVGYDIPDFAKDGDTLWEVRIADGGVGFGGKSKVRGIIWVNATSKSSRVLTGPEGKQGTAASRPSTSKSEGVGNSPR